MFPAPRKVLATWWMLIPYLLNDWGHFYTGRLVDSSNLSWYDPVMEIALWQKSDRVVSMFLLLFSKVALTLLLNMPVSARTGLLSLVILSRHVCKEYQWLNRALFTKHIPSEKIVTIATSDKCYPPGMFQAAMTALIALSY